MAKELRGPRVVVADGDFQIGAQVEYTTKAIKFKPFVAVLTAFPQAQTATVSWVKANDKTASHKVSVQSIKNYFVPEKQQTNSDFQLTLTCTIAGQKSSLTITNTYKPNKPRIGVKRMNDSNFQIHVPGRSKGTAVDVDRIVVERQEDYVTADWEAFRTQNINSYHSYDYTFTDNDTSKGHRYRYRARAINAAGSSGNVVSGWVCASPPDVTEVTHERVNNKECDVFITRDYSDVVRGVLTGFIVQRSESGGAWKTITSSLDNDGSELDDTVHYADCTCSPDNYYRYRIRPKNSQVTSLVEGPSENGTDPTYNTPNPPSKVTATYTSTGSVLLKMTNKSKTADTMEIQRRIDSGTWTDVATVDQSESLCTEYIDASAISGTSIQYRVRNGRTGMQLSERWSEWKSSNEVVALSVPDKPTIIIPISGTPVTYDMEAVRLAWVHNPTDGTDQESAAIRYKKEDASTWNEISIGAVSYYDLTVDAETFAPNDKVTWEVSTKGAHSSYSDWSDEATFIVYSKPEITFTALANPVTNLPIGLEWTYNDACGTLSALTLNVLRDDEIEKTIDIDVGTGESGTYTYSLADFLFENNTSYELQVTARSSTGLTSTDELGITIEYVPVELTGKLLPDVDLDEETGHAIITISEAEEVEGGTDVPGQIIEDSPVAAAYLYRLVDGERVLLAQVEAGDQITDRYCPLNKLFSYELFQVAESGQISFVQEEVELDTDFWFVYWKDSIARAIWNPTGDVKLSRPEKVQVRYSGREYPVTYDSLAMGETFSFSTTIVDRSELDAFRAMMRDGGQGVWKSCDGDVYAADFDFSYSAKYSDISLTWECKLEVTRIESEVL